MLRALRSIAVVVALATAAGALLAWFAGLVEEKTERNRRLAATQALREMVLAAGREVPLNWAASGDVLLCEPALAILRGSGNGYGGAFSIAVAFGADRRAQAVRVLEHGETPGFADILEPGSTWLARFRGTPADVHAVTGATVTSEAVIGAVRRLEARLESDAAKAECFEAFEEQR